MAAMADMLKPEFEWKVKKRGEMATCVFAEGEEQW